SEEKKLQDELARAAKPNAPPLDEDKVIGLVASMLTYSREADQMRRRLNVKYHIRIAGEDDLGPIADQPSGDEVDGSAWNEIDAISPRDSAMVTAMAAAGAVAKQRLDRLKARLALRKPLGRF